MKPQDFAIRASEVLGDALSLIATACRKMHSNHSKRGVLTSSMTATEAVQIYQRYMQLALSQVLEEASKILEHRGKAWRAGMDAIAQSLETEIAASSSILAPSFKLASLKNQGMETEVRAMLERVGSDLRRQLTEFREGWTAPSPKKWPVRHPAAYAILLIALGSVIGAIITPALSPLTTNLFAKPRADLKASLGAVNMAGMSVSVTNTGDLAGNYAATEITVKRGGQVAKTYMVPADAPMRVVMIPAKSSKLIELEPFSETGWFWVRSNDACTLDHIFIDNDGRYFSTRTVEQCDTLSEYYNLILSLRHLRDNRKEGAKSAPTPRAPGTTEAADAQKRSNSQ